MVKLVNLTRVVTSILLILVLLFVYSNLPNRVGILYNSAGQVDWYLDKNQFFYASLILFLSLNLMTVLFTKIFQFLPIRPGRFFFSNELFKDNFTAWLSALAPVMNLFFVFMVAFVGIYNNGDVDLINSYSYLAYLGQFLVFIWLLVLIYILLKKGNK